MTGTELKDARIKKGLTQVKLARILQTDPNNVYRWESGRHKVPRWVPMVLKVVPNATKKAATA